MKHCSGRQSIRKHVQSGHGKVLRCRWCAESRTVTHQYEFRIPCYAHHKNRMPSDGLVKPAAHGASGLSRSAAFSNTQTSLAAPVWMWCMIHSRLRGSHSQLNIGAYSMRSSSPCFFFNVWIRAVPANLRTKVKLSVASATYTACCSSTTYDSEGMLHGKVLLMMLRAII